MDAMDAISYKQHKKTFAEMGNKALARTGRKTITLGLTKDSSRPDGDSRAIAASEVK